MAVAGTTETAKFRKLKKWQHFEVEISIFLVFFVLWVLKKKDRKNIRFEIRGSCDKRTSDEDFQISNQSVN